jgi:hypothetical protein
MFRRVFNQIRTSERGLRGLPQLGRAGEIDRDELRHAALGHRHPVMR